jgi:CRP-like cAMP-binding protein
MATETKHLARPAIHAVHPWVPGSPERRPRHQLLGDDERAQLAKVASILRFKKDEQIFVQGDKADAVFNIVSGVVTVYRTRTNGDYIISFLHPGDLFGLSEEGHYLNTAKAATSVTVYKIPLSAFRRILDTNAELDVDFIIKLCEDLREAQHHALVLAQKRAATRLAMFLELQEHLQMTDSAASEIHLPMDRSSIASYLGLTPAALSRAFRILVSRQVISCRDRHHVKILDREAVSRLADAR